MRRSVARPRKMAVTAWLPSWGHGSGFGNSAVFVRQSQRMPRWSPTWPPGNTKTLEKSQGGQGGQPLSPRWSARQSASALAGGRALTPTSQNLANWQTQFFFGRNHHRGVRLRRQLSLPTVANSVANWQTHFRNHGLL